MANYVRSNPQNSKAIPNKRTTNHGAKEPAREEQKSTTQSERGQTRRNKTPNSTTNEPKASLSTKINSHNDQHQTSRTKAHSTSNERQQQQSCTNRPPKRPIDPNKIKNSKLKTNRKPQRISAALSPKIPVNLNRNPQPKRRRNTTIILRIIVMETMFIWFTYIIIQ